MAKKDIIISSNIANLTKRLDQLDQIDPLIYHNRKHPLKILDQVTTSKFNYYTPIPDNRPSTVAVDGWITTDGNCPTLLVAVPPCHKFHGLTSEELDRIAWQVYRHGYSFTYNEKIEDVECLKEVLEKFPDLKEYWIIGCTYSMWSDYQAQTNCEYVAPNGYYGSNRRAWTMNDLHKELKHMIDNLSACMTNSFWNSYYKYLDEKMEEFKKETEKEFEELPF